MIQMLRCLLLALVLCCLRGPMAGAAEPTFEPSAWAAWNKGFSAHYPGKTWQKFATPEEAGWSTAKLDEVRAKSQSLGSAAVMIVLDGVVVAEWGEVERRFLSHSIRKSFLSALYGIAADRGQIALSDSLGTLRIDEDTPLTAEEKTATIADLLKARSGVFLPAAYENKDMRKKRPKRGSHKPGSFWHYNNWDFNALGTIYNRKTNSDLFKAFKSQIAGPLQMQDFDLRHTYYHLEARHSRHAAYPFRMSARDLARFGLLFLNEGKWRNTSIVPANWVRESTKSYSVSERQWRGYGYMWWRYLGPLSALGAYEASGAGGHKVVVVPGARLVVVHRTNTFEGKRVGGGNIRRLVNAVLGARTGPVVDKPKILPRAEPAAAEDTPAPPAEIEALLGTYDSSRFRLHIERRPGGLQAFTPTFGRFHMLRMGERDYVIEDAGYRLSFEGSGDAPASGVTVTFPHTQPVSLKRVP